LRWIASRTGQNPVFPSFWGSSADYPWRDPSRPNSSSPCHFPAYADAQHQYATVDLSLPDRAVVDECFHYFRTSHFRLEFPVVDTTLFADTIQLAYAPCHGTPTPDQAGAKACVFAFLSVISLFKDQSRETGPSIIDGFTCAMKAQQLLPLTLRDCNLIGLQTVQMLVRLGCPPSSFRSATYTPVAAVNSSALLRPRSPRCHVPLTSLPDHVHAWRPHPRRPVVCPLSLHVFG